MKHGLVLYGRIVSGLTRHPATARGVARRHKVCECVARYLLRQLLQLEVVRITSWRRVSKNGPPDRVFGRGGAPNAPPPLTTRGKPGAGPVRHAGKLKPAILAFASVWRELEEPITATQLGEETGIGMQAIYRFLTAMRECNAVRVADWKRSGSISVALFQRGHQPDAPRPEREPNEVVKQRARDRARARAEGIPAAWYAPIHQGQP